MDSKLCCGCVSCKTEIQVTQDLVKVVIRRGVGEQDRGVEREGECTLHRLP